MRARLIARGWAAVLVTAAVWLFAGAAQASAAPRYASPTGSGSGCTAPGTSPGPCDIFTAVSAAAAGDEVIVEPGDYGSLGTPMSSEVLALSANVSIDAAPGPRPRLFFADAGVELGGTGDTISGLDIEAASSNSALDLVLGTSANRMLVHNSVDVACSVLGPITNSVCWTDGSTGDALTVEPGSGSLLSLTLRNDTIEATGAGSSGDFGLFVASSGTSQGVTVNALNVIVHGSREDIVAKPEMPNSPITVNLGYSNYAKGVVGGNGQSPGAINQVPAGSDQTTTPAFVNAAGGDFRERASSSGTVDRGHDDGSLRPVDLNGDPRIVGSAPDIGAYEHQPPTVTASANPASIAGSAPATFSASGTPSIPGDSLSYVWRFDDAATAGGPRVSHGFAAPGSHLGTVTVSDLSGLTAAATARVTVTPAKLSALGISPHKVSLAGRKVKATPAPTTSPSVAGSAATNSDLAPTN